MLPEHRVYLERQQLSPIVMPYSLKGRNVLVTGGSRQASKLWLRRNIANTRPRGLGALICEKFAAEGSNVAVNYVSSKDRADEVAEKVRGFGVKAVVIQAVR